MEPEIIYERDIYKSYMKLSADREQNLDERILLAKKLDGVLSVKKCFFQEKGQYWYDISGKQALDVYCKVNELGIELLEKLILQICNQLEVLEWNLIREECLFLRPDLVFLGGAENEIFFTVYPAKKGDIHRELRDFLEFVLTKVDHEDTQAVYVAYAVYETILRGDYQIADLKKRILENRMDNRINNRMERKEESENKEFAEFLEESEQPEKSEKPEESEQPKKSEKPEQSELKIKIQNIQSFQDWENILEEILKKIREKMVEILEKVKIEIPGFKENEPEIVYPNEPEEVSLPTNIHPTTCLSMLKDDVRGILLPEDGSGTAFLIGKEMCIIGKSPDVRMQIERDTVSQVHAKIEWNEDGYYIEDMNSTNGTYVNGEMLNYKESRKLHPNDQICFADVKYRFQ